MLGLYYLIEVMYIPYSLEYAPIWNKRPPEKPIFEAPRVFSRENRVTQSE